MSEDKDKAFEIMILVHIDDTSICLQSFGLWLCYVSAFPANLKYSIDSGKSEMLLLERGFFFFFFVT